MSTPYIRTVNGITVVLRGRPYHVATGDKHFEEVRELVEGGYSPDAVLEVLERVKRKVEAASAISPNLRYNGGIVTYKGEALRGYAVDKLVALVEEDGDVEPLAKFLEKLQLNPDSQVVEHLYSFLEHGNMPLTREGNFLAYKAVRADYRDIHSGTFDNRVGCVVEMQRNRVDSHRDRTCSSGLHACSYDYLPSFANANGHVMVLEINPADVVAIPNDYNDTKMRVSRYKVVSEVTGYYNEQRNILAETHVRQERYVVMAFDEDTGTIGGFVEVAQFGDLDEAKQFVSEIVGEGVIQHKVAKVTDEFGTVVFQASI